MSSYQVLARKYRPQNFADLIGQDAMIQTLNNAFSSGRIAQAWILTGIRGVGKTTTARILARALNYKSKDIDSPTTQFSELGEDCQEIMNGSHIDVIEIDAASHTSIDNIREIIEQVKYRPLKARYKIYIIDEVHMLSNQAFNGLLKTLEEPPAHVKFIFATTEIQKVPVTILSRCQRFDLRRIETNILTDYLEKICSKEGIKAQKDALLILAQSSEGSVRDSLSLLEQAIAYSDGEITVNAINIMLGLAARHKIITLFTDIINGDVVSCLNLFDELYQSSANPLQILIELANFNHLVIKLKMLKSEISEFDILPIEKEKGQDLAAKLSLNVLERNWRILQESISTANSAINIKQHCEMLLIRLCHAAKLPNMEQIASLLPHFLDKANKIGENNAGCETIVNNILEKFPNANITITKDVN